jgi:hypothetical protein
LAPRRIRGRRGGERAHRARLGDSFFENLSVHRLAVRQHQPRVDRFVLLSERRVDLELREQRVHTERACLVGNDRDDPRAEVGLFQQRAQQTRERGRGRGLDLVAGAGRELVDDFGTRDEHALGAFDAVGQVAGERTPALHHVLVLRRAEPGMEIRRHVAFEGIVRKFLLHVEAIAQRLELAGRHLLDLVRGIARLEVGAERPALDRLGEDDGRCALVLDRGFVRRVHLAVVVAAAR